MQIFDMATTYQVKYMAVVACVDPTAKITVDMKEVKDFCEAQQLFFVEVNQKVIKPGAYYDTEYDKSALKQLNLFAHSLVAGVKKPRNKPTTRPPPKEKSWCSIL